MMKNKKTIFVISGVVVLLILASGASFFKNSSSESATSEPTSNEIKTVSVSTNYLKFENVDALDTAADLVVIGEATQDFSKRKHMTTYFDDGTTLQDFYTLTEIKVDQVLKESDDISKAADGLTLEIVEPLALVQNAGETIKLTHENYTELQKGEKTVIFLKKNTFGQYSIFNQNLGKFSLNSSGTSKALIGDEAAEYNTFKSDVLKKYGVQEVE